MKVTTPVATTVLVAFVAYTVDQMAGAKMLINAPSGTVISAATASSSSAQVANNLFYNMITDERIEAPVLAPFRVIQT